MLRNAALGNIESNTVTIVEDQPAKHTIMLFTVDELGIRDMVCAIVALGIKAFQEYVSKFPQSPHLCGINFNIAESFYYLERFEEGVPYYQKVLDDTCDDQTKLGAYTGQIWSNIKLKKFILQVRLLSFRNC